MKDYFIIWFDDRIHKMHTTNPIKAMSKFNQLKGDKYVITATLYYWDDDFSRLNVIETK